MLSLNNKKRGFGLLEIVIASAIITVSLGALILSFTNTLALEENNLRRTQAVFLAEEGLEMMRSLRASGWNNVSTHGQYQVDCLSGACVLASPDGTLLSGLFNRVIEIAPAYRDSNDRLTEVGTIDPDTVFVTVSVTWSTKGSEKTEVLQTYLTNILDN